ncbi:MAG: hypothetical protein WC842_02870 [Candidatus Paceibacterota bacterium]
MYKKRIANGKKLIDIIPIVIEPIQIQLTLVIIEVQNRHVAVAVGIKPRICEISSMSPQLDHISSLYHVWKLYFSPIFHTKYLFILRNCKIIPKKNVSFFVQYSAISEFDHAKP